MTANKNDTGYSQRVLVLGASPVDARMTGEIFAEAGIAVKACHTIDDLQCHLENGLGALLVAEEMLFPTGLDRLKELLRKQPPWSDIPIIVLTRGGEMTEAGFEILRSIESLGHVTILDRPVRLMTLISVVRAALKSRQRQYDMRDLLEKYKHSSEAAEAANRAKNSFLANMSHEIRTPLSAILGFGDLLSMEDTDEDERAEFVHAIQRNGKLLAGIIDDVLDLSKIEAGKLILERIRCSLPEILSDIMTSLGQQASAKGLQILLNAEPSTPKTIVTDPTRLKQILINIVGNAIKFTSEGRVEMSVRLQTRGHKKCLLFIVRDSGRGISAEQQRTLFQPFVQADDSTTRKYGGTGLGLVLSKRIAQDLGGGIELTKSELGVGSTFTVFIEAVDAASCFHDHSNSDSMPRATLKTSGQLAGCHVLIVEDMEDNRKLLSHLLWNFGASVDFAKNGFDGVQMALANGYDVVLMDLQMPIKDGYQATSELRIQGYRKPIIAVSASAMTDEREKAIAAGCDGHISKPINEISLFNAIHAHACKPQS